MVPVRVIQQLNGLTRPVEVIKFVRKEVVKLLMQTYIHMDLTQVRRMLEVMMPIYSPHMAFTTKEI